MTNNHHNYVRAPHRPATHVTITFLATKLSLQLPQAPPVLSAGLTKPLACSTHRPNLALLAAAPAAPVTGSPTAQTCQVR